MSAGVIQNIYPLFERNRILKKEMLWSLRDYAFAHAGVEYQEYGQGILWGCGLSVQGEEIAIRPGLLKYGQAVCIMMEETRIPFGAAQEMRAGGQERPGLHRLPDGACAVRGGEERGRRV